MEIEWAKSTIFCISHKVMKNSNSKFLNKLFPYLTPKGKLYIYRHTYISIYTIFMYICIFVNTDLLKVYTSRLR